MKALFASVRRAGLDVSTNKKISELYEEVEYLIRVCLDIPENEPLAGPGKAGSMAMPPKNKKKKFALTFNPFGKKKGAQDEAHTTVHKSACLFVVGELLIKQQLFLSQYSGHILDAVKAHYLCDARDGAGGPRGKVLAQSQDVYYTKINALQTLVKFLYSSIAIPGGNYADVWKFLLRVLATDKAFENKNIALSCLKILLIKSPARFGATHSADMLSNLFKVFHATMGAMSACAA